MRNLLQAKKNRCYVAKIFQGQKVVMTVTTLLKVTSDWTPLSQHKVTPMSITEVVVSMWINEESHYSPRKALLQKIYMYLREIKDILR